MFFVRLIFVLRALFRAVVFTLKKWQAPRKKSTKYYAFCRCGKFLKKRFYRLFYFTER